MKERGTWVYLNVDLEIEGANSLDAIESELGESVIVLHTGPGSSPDSNFMSIESADDFDGPDKSIQYLCKLIENLSSEAQKAWRESSKVFDVGYEIKGVGSAGRFMLQPDTIRKVSSLGAALAFTCYPRTADKG